MTHQPIFLGQANAMASGSSYNVKRKTYDEDDEPSQPMRVRSPPLKRRATFPAPAHMHMPLPDLMTDCSNSATNSDDDIMMDQDGDMDMDQQQQQQTGQNGYDMDRGFVPHYDYEYGMSGSGGIGFGPGAEEDEDFTEEAMAADAKSYTPFQSLTPHSNPNHFSNVPPYTSNTSLPFGQPATVTSPLSAQPFATTLPAPDAAARGLMQPAVAGPLPVHASDVEKARSVHGPQCQSIPKLVISPHADPLTGKQAMYTMCPDCGSCERTA